MYIFNYINGQLAEEVDHGTMQEMASEYEVYFV